jgi:ribosomal protein L12E/L44/L45/RPP1/RPP2
MADSIFVINGFYMSMREKYTQDSAKICWFVAEWDESACSWSDFRGKVLGATDPNEAAEGSARNTILKKWQELGLASEPNVGDNGVHASASPFEALAERMNWLGATLAEDEFGAALLAAGLDAETIMAWTKDPQVDVDGTMGSLFDALEDTNCSDCIKKAASIAKATGASPATKNSAFLFLKPHAANAACAALLEECLTKAGITITGKGELAGPKIEADKLIDNHYYAIANKAALTLPKDLNPPAAKQEEFNTTFGISWPDALAAGNVYNAVDGCKKLGIDGGEMDRRWAESKKEKRLVKFGGGFYAGKVLA